MESHLLQTAVFKKLSHKKIDVVNNTTNNLDETTKGFLKGVKTSCRSMGHTTEAAKFVRRCMFGMLDYFGLNSLFLSTTPDDECSFRVRLYSKPQNWVSTYNLDSTKKHYIPIWNFMFILLHIIYGHI